VYVKTIATCKGGTFFETQCSFLTPKHLLKLQMGSSSARAANTGGVRKIEIIDRSLAISREQTQASQRDRMPHYVGWNLVNCRTQLYEKSHLKRLATCEWPWRRSRSLELPPFDRSYVTSCSWSVIITSLYLAPFPRHYHFIMATLHVFFSPILSHNRLDVYHTSTDDVALVQI